jgi:hypothetical protein
MPQQLGASERREEDTAAITPAVSARRSSRNRETVRSQPGPVAPAANFRQEILMPNSQRLPTTRLLLA